MSTDFEQITKDIPEHTIVQILAATEGLDVGGDLTFNQLQLFNDSEFSMSGVKNASSLKPDAYFLPKTDLTYGIVAECKTPRTTLADILPQLTKYMLVAKTKYNIVVGIAYNGFELQRYIFDSDNNVVPLTTIQNCALPTQPVDKMTYLPFLQDTSSAQSLPQFDLQKIKVKIKTAGNLLYVKYNMYDVTDRIVLITCLVYASLNNYNLPNKFDELLNTIHSVLTEKEHSTAKTNLQKLLTIFDKAFAKMMVTNNVAWLESLIVTCTEIAHYLNTTSWDQIDVMSAFFNELNAFTADTQLGQVFTPQHITDFMYKLLKCTDEDHILDACSGSGTFLITAGVEIEKNNGLKSPASYTKINHNLYGIEIAEDVFTLLCLNFLIRNWDISHLFLADARQKSTFGTFLKDANITRVLMNPPYEQAFQPLEIVKQTLNATTPHAQCAFLFPWNMFVRNVNKILIKNILETHNLTKIIKLPNIFQNVAAVNHPCIFVFESYTKQQPTIHGFYLKDDGFVYQTKQGRVDNGAWQTIEAQFLTELNNPVTWQSNELLNYLPISVTNPAYPVVLNDDELIVTKQQLTKTIVDHLTYCYPQTSQFLKQTRSGENNNDESN